MSSTALLTETAPPAPRTGAGLPVAIRAEGLSKSYRIGELRARYKTIRESLGAAFGRSLSRLRRRKSSDPTMWALRDVSFEVRQGEVIGVIGRNGAGKSTLLKVLSRITPPTLGQAEIFGRVGSLLEVGIGFHPELSGRENVFMNGAVLGMRRAEIEAKFDEIVAFAEVAKFIDTPIKHYSTGMYMRLAFAVAAHLEPEILLVDDQHVGLEVGRDREREAHVHPARIVFYRGVKKLFDFGEINNLIEVPAYFHLAHAQDGAIQENILPSSEFWMKAGAYFKQTG